MKHMPVAEVQRHGKAMAQLRKVTSDQADAVLHNFTENVESEAPMVGRSPRFLKKVLASSLGEERASSLFDRLVEGDAKGLDSLQIMEAKEITEIIRGEHPQVLAIVLAGLESGKPAQIVAELPVRQATDIVTRIARMDEVPENAIAELDEVLQHKFKQSGTLKMTNMGGIRSARPAEVAKVCRKMKGVVWVLYNYTPEVVDAFSDFNIYKIRAHIGAGNRYNKLLITSEPLSGRPGNSHGFKFRQLQDLENLGMSTSMVHVLGSVLAMGTIVAIRLLGGNGDRTTKQMIGDVLVGSSTIWLFSQIATSALRGL